MRHLLISVMSAVLLVVVTSNTSADDSVAALGAGGIVLEHSDDVSLLSEDLSISRHEVRVRFVFRNETDKPIETLLAFVAPDIGVEQYHKRAPRDLTAQDPVNFINFAIEVDGQRIVPSIDSRAVLNGEDVTDELLKADVPPSFYHPEFEDKLKKLVKPKWTALLNAGLVSEGLLFGLPAINWDMRTRFYWTQIFPPGKIVTVEHTYHPIVGIDPNFTPSYLSPYIINRYCIDERAIQRIHTLWDRSVQRNGYGALTVHEVDYILSTGANWRHGKIGQFRLNLATDSPNVTVLTCHEGLKHMSATTLSAEHSSFSPKRDLHILFVSDETDQNSWHFQSSIGLEGLAYVNANGPYRLEVECGNGGGPAITFVSTTHASLGWVESGSRTNVQFEIDGKPFIESFECHPGGLSCGSFGFPSAELMRALRQGHNLIVRRGERFEAKFTLKGSSRALLPLSVCR